MLQAERHVTVLGRLQKIPVEYAHRCSSRPRTRVKCHRTVPSDRFRFCKQADAHVRSRLDNRTTCQDRLLQPVEPCVINPPSSWRPPIPRRAGLAPAALTGTAPRMRARSANLGLRIADTSLRNADTSRRLKAPRPSFRSSRRHRFRSTRHIWTSDPPRACRSTARAAQPSRRERPDALRPSVHGSRGGCGCRAAASPRSCSRLEARPARTGCVHRDLRRHVPRS